MTQIMFFFKNAGLLLLALFFARAMYQDFYVVDPYNPSLRGSSAYGHNSRDALHVGLVFLVVELLIVYAIIRPWSYQRSWRRALLALVIFVPWMILHAMASMHAGSVVALHVVWLLVLSVVLFVLFGVSVLSKKAHTS